MNWFLLLLFIPAVIVPAVLLFGFAGCGFQGPSLSLSAPINLVAVPTPSSATGSAAILTWSNTDIHTPMGAQIERAIDGGVFEVLPDPSDPSKPLVVMGETFTDTGLPGGTAFLYQVRGNLYGNTSIDASNMATVTTFETAFIEEGVTMNTDQSGTNGYTIVQTLANTVLRASGTLVSLTFRGPTTGTLTLDKIYISNVATTGDPYDSDVPPVLVTSDFVVNNGTVAAIPANAFFLDQTKPLLVAFDVNLTNGTLRNCILSGGGVMSYARGVTVPGQAVQQAGLQNRTAGYGPAAALYLIHKIEVM